MDLELFERQRELESQMQGAGLERFLKNLEGAVARGEESVTPYGREVMRVTIAPFAEAIKAWCVEASTGRGRRHTLVGKIRGMDPLVVSFLTIKLAIDGARRRNSVLQRVATEIGTAIEEEQRFTKFQEGNPALFGKVLTNLNSRTSNKGHKRTVLLHTMNQKAEIEWKAWTRREKFLVGHKLIELLIESLGLIKLVKKTVKHNDRRYFIETTEALVERIDRFMHLIYQKDGVYYDKGADCHYSIFSPVYLPTLVQPKPWDDKLNGGYWFLDQQRSGAKLIKHLPKTLIEDIANNVDMSPVYDAVNAVQDTGWRINHRVFEVMEEIWGAGTPVGKLPSREPIEVPPKDFNVPEDKAEADPEELAKLKRWKMAARIVHEENSKKGSAVIQVFSALDIARQFKDEERFYFPHSLDFRGRMYPLPPILNPQGTDYAKALLVFADGAPIEDVEALGYLMIHGANCWGNDKVSFEERIAWVEERGEDILRVSNDPLVDRWWMDAEEPWQFLAFCFEYAACVEHGWGYVSHLPIALDGSCNGLQHFSAMLRDPVGAAATNLIPLDKPADIYQQVADETEKRLEARLTEDDAEIASRWLDYRVTRKLVKRSVMILPYGGTLKACRDYIYDVVTEGGGYPFEADELRKACSYLANHVWAAIGDVVIGARKVMAWLRQCAALWTKEGNCPMIWTTPDGFPVWQAYYDLTQSRVKTTLEGGSPVFFVLVEHGEKDLDLSRQKNGISPNFVHSMDACALRLYIKRAKELGISNFAVVHDSYGTLAAQVGLSSQCIRDTFADMYDENDVLFRFYEEVKRVAPNCPAPPAQGTLLLDLVRDSGYFFA